MFDIVVGPDVNASTKVVSPLAQAGGYPTYTPVDVVDIEQRYTTQAAINEVLAQFSRTRFVFMMTSFILSISGANVKSIAQTTDYAV